MCDYFKMPYLTLIEQPAWFMMTFQVYLEGKAKTEEAKSKKTQYKPPAVPSINKYKFTARKR